MKRSILCIFLFSTIGLAACNGLDVIGDQSEKSYQAVLESLQDQVSKDTDFGGWSIEALDGSTRFEWSEDFSKTTGYDIRIVTDLQPFLDAGLDPAKLPAVMLIDNQIIVGASLGDDNIIYTVTASPLDSYKKLVKHYRDRISYHMSLDHFGIKMDNGNMFEWAKDMKTNDKDIVFVLNPQPFIEAGVNPEKIEGWAYAKVETMDDSGKKIQEDKLLKPFDVES